MGRVDVFLTPVQSIYLQSHKPTYKHQNTETHSQVTNIQIFDQVIKNKTANGK